MKLPGVQGLRVSLACGLRETPKPGIKRGGAEAPAHNQQVLNTLIATNHCLTDPQMSGKCDMAAEAIDSAW